LVSVGIGRRTAFRLMATGGAVARLAACGGSTAAPASSVPASSPQAGASPASPKPSAAAAPASGAAGTSAKTGGTLNVALPDLGSENLDIILASTNNNILPMVYEPLLRYNEQGDLIPWLAESWEVSKDGLLYTF